MSDRYCPGEVLPGCVRSGLLTVSNWDMGTSVDSTWYCTNAFFPWSDSKLSVPDGSDVKALSVGAKIISPFPELLSWLSICCAAAVDLSRRMNVLNCPALASTPVMFVVPGAGAGAAGVGAAVGACCADATMMATENTMRRSTGFFMARMVSLPGDRSLPLCLRVL
jgi:hypothetical protein